MFYLRSFVIGVLLTLSYTCNGEVNCGGGYYCPANNDCEWSAQRGRICKCKVGYVQNPNSNCVRSCKSGQPCPANAYCTWNAWIGSYCGCKTGYRENAGNCVDNNECLIHNICPSTRRCVNTIGSYRCGCYNGYRLNNNQCIDVDECSTFDICGPPSAGVCDNTPGSYNCNCRTGYTRSTDGACTDVDECLTLFKVCGPSSAGQCINIPGSYNCNCSTGYNISSDGKCTDVDECQSSDACDPNAQCANFPGHYNCTCNKGFSGDGKSCTDIDECIQMDDACTDNADCVNYPGGYNCSCSMGFSGDASNCTAVAPVSSSLADSPGAIAGIAVGGLVFVLAITTILVFVITRRNRKKRKSEEPSLSNPTIDQEPNYVNVRMSGVNSGGNNNGGDATVVSGDVNVDALGELYSNNLVKERKRQQRNLQENAYPDDDAVIYSNEQPQSASGDGYDALRKPSALQHNPHTIALPDEETYNHLNQRSLTIPTTVGDSTEASLYNHLYSGGNVPQTHVTSQGEQGTVDGIDEYSLA